jgi:hypothetical protein
MLLAFNFISQYYWFSYALYCLQILFKVLVSIENHKNKPEVKFDSIT